MEWNVTLLIGFIVYCFICNYIVQSTFVVIVVVIIIVVAIVLSLHSIIVVVVIVVDDDVAVIAAIIVVIIIVKRNEMNGVSGNCSALAIKVILNKKQSDIS